MEFVLFSLMLAGIAIFHRHTLLVALAGLGALLVWKLGFTGFSMWQHLMHESRLLANLFGLLMGFAILARHFEHSRIPNLLPRWLPQNWTGCFVLLLLVFGMATFIDNIAAAMLGGALALVVFRRKVHIGYVAAIAAAANAGGTFSVIGNTTTTVMWIAGVPAMCVFRAIVGSAVGLLTFGIMAARQQHHHQPIVRDVTLRGGIDRGHLAIVILIPLLAMAANVLVDLMAAGVWAAILLGAMFRRTDWGELRRSFAGSLFLVVLVFCASLMPVQDLPAATPGSTFVLGVISAVFNNIPLTKLALSQGGYDWGFAAYSIGCGGSMLWFGSSAGVALGSLFPASRSVSAWAREGWHVALGYVLGFLAMLWLLGWHPQSISRADQAAGAMRNSPTSVLSCPDRFASSPALCCTCSPP